MGARFSILIQTDFGSHPASCTMGTGALSLEVKRPGRGFEHPSLYSAEVKERVELYLYPPPRLHGLFWGEHYLYLYHLSLLSGEKGESPISYLQY